MLVQVDCDFSIRVVHASAADLDLDRLKGSQMKPPGVPRSADSHTFPAQLVPAYKCSLDYILPAFIHFLYVLTSLSWVLRHVGA